MTIDTESVTRLAHLLKVIADETRLRILGTLATAPLTGKDLATRLDLTPATISHHMRKLVDAGIVTSEADAQRVWYRLNNDVLRLARSAPLTHADERGEPVQPGDADDQYRQRVIRNFFDGERLKNIPARRKERVIVLQRLLERFDPSRTYAEREVNDILRVAHEDVATLRRELVDYGYMQRDRGVYQLARGTPPRGSTVGQEVPRDEAEWLMSLVAGTIAGKGS